MPLLSDLTQSSAVLSAIAECDRLGRDGFLAKHGFGRAKAYYLLHNGNQYDSKAIAGVAVGIQTGTGLPASDFSGGAPVVRRLALLGFSVVAKEIDDSTSALPEELVGEFEEGAGLSVTINRYERSAAARAACLAARGTACLVCGFEYSDVYGEEFTGFIHVHHVRPLAGRQSPGKVDPKTDLAPVCPNCHAAIHYGGANRSLDEMRALLRSRNATKSK